MYLLLDALISSLKNNDLPFPRMPHNMTHLNDRHHLYLFRYNISIYFVLSYSPFGSVHAPMYVWQ